VHACLCPAGSEAAIDTVPGIDAGRADGIVARVRPGARYCHRDARPAAHRLGLVWDVRPSLLPLGFGASGWGLGFGFGCPPFAMMRLPPFEEDLLPGGSTSEYARLD
jgi:hypothetical protein